MAEIEVPLSVASEILASILDVREDGLRALRARIRQLGDMGVPRNGRGRPHQRLRYGLTQLTELAVALLLTDADTPPSVSARYVREGWNRLAPIALEGASAAMPENYLASRTPRAVGAIAVIGGGTMKELGRRGMRQPAGSMPLSEVSARSPHTRLGEALGGSYTARLLDFAAFMPAIVRALERHAVVPLDLVDSFDALMLSEEADDGTLPSPPCG